MMHHQTRIITNDSALLNPDVESSNQNQDGRKFSNDDSNSLNRSSLSSIMTSQDNNENLIQVKLINDENLNKCEKIIL